MLTKEMQQSMTARLNHIDDYHSMEGGLLRGAAGGPDREAQCDGKRHGDSAGFHADPFEGLSRLRNEYAGARAAVNLDPPGSVISGAVCVILNGL